MTTMKIEIPCQRGFVTRRAFVLKIGSASCKKDKPDQMGSASFIGTRSSLVHLCCSLVFRANLYFFLAVFDLFLVLEFLALNSSCKAALLMIFGLIG